jgi:hypothetical protein
MGRPQDTDTITECARKGDDVRLKKLMAEDGFNIQETYTKREWNILHFAMSGGHIACIDAIIEVAGSLTPTLLKQTDTLGFVPFRLARQKGYVDVVLFMDGKGLGDKK